MYFFFHRTLDRILALARHHCEPMKDVSFSLRTSLFCGLSFRLSALQNNIPTTDATATQVSIITLKAIKHELPDSWLLTTFSPCRFFNKNTSLSLVASMQSWMSCLHSAADYSWFLCLPTVLIKEPSGWRFHFFFLFFSYQWRTDLPVRFVLQPKHEARVLRFPTRAPWLL